MALRRWLAGCAAGAALAAALPAALAAAQLGAPSGRAGAAVAEARATRSSLPAESSQFPACPPAPIGYSTCLVHVLRPRRGAQDRPTGHAGPQSAPAGLAPDAITTAYGFSTAGGSGSTIGIVDAYGDPTITTDLGAFSTQYGLRPCTSSNHCLTAVNETGGTATAPPPSRTTGWALETSLDVEWAHALAPDADVLLVEATSNSDTDLFAAVRYATTKSQYVTMPWGGTEFAGETAFDATFADPSVSYFAAAGDTASELSYPATSPDVIAVGGTTLTVTSATDAWKSETAWETAGGGCSKYETAAPAQAAYPSYDQQGANCAGRRAVPDLSLDANPSTGVAVYDTDGYPGWLVAGGTSASTDMVAAHAAETGQHVDATVVYGKSMSLYNVTTGSNGHPCEKGYNLCSGLGSWNDAVRSTSAGSAGSAGSPGSAGTSGNGAGSALSFASAAQQLAVGAWSGPFTVVLSRPAPGAGTTVSVFTNSSTGELSTSSSGSAPSRSLSLHVAAGSSTVPTFYYEDTKAGTPTIAVSAAGWAPATQSETVTTSPALIVTVTPGSPVRSGRSYHVPLTTTVTSSGRPLNRVSVTISVYGGSCTGAHVASGAGNTGARGDVVFTFTTSATGSYCARAGASAPGATPGSTAAEFTVSAALPPVAGGTGARARLDRVGTAG